MRDKTKAEVQEAALKAAYANQANIGQDLANATSPGPYNQVQELQWRVENLQAQIQTQEAELLKLYRQLNERNY